MNEKKSILELSGKIKLINEVQSFGSKGFQKREFVVTTQEQYPQDVKFECVQDRVSLTDNYKPGDEVKICFNIRGNEYQGKYYVNLQAWKIDPVEGATADTAQKASVQSHEQPPHDKELANIPSAQEETDDLPF